MSDATFKIINPLRLEPLPLVSAPWWKRAWDRVRFWMCRTRQYKLFEDYIVQLANGDILIAPRDAVIDGASVPPVLWPSLGHPLDTLLDWAAIHDCGYQGVLEWRDKDGVNKIYTRLDVDRLIYEIGDAVGVPRGKQHIAYAGVRAGGLGPWKKGRARK